MSASAKVMLVEDELIVATSIAHNLEKDGYTVTGIAATSQHALALMEENLPDVVLMDIRIRGPVDGVQTAKEIRQRFRVPVIFMTAYSDAKTLERAKLAEPFGYIVKPVMHAALTTAIDVALYKRSIERKLDEHRAWLATGLQACAEATIITDVEGRVEFLNRAAENLMGLTFADNRGKQVADVLRITGRSVREGVQPLLETAVQQGRTMPLSRDTLLHRTAGDVLVSGQITASLDETRRAAGAVITLHDLQAEGQEAKQLRQQQKMALIGHFAEGVAADFYGLLDLIANSLAHLPDAMHLATIQQSAQVAMTIARQLLNLAKDAVVSPEMVPMNTVAAETLPLLKQLAGPRVDFTAEYPADLGAVFGNRHQMAQLLVNLLLNAKERVGSEGTIRLQFDNVNAGKSFIRIRLAAQQSPNTEEAWTALTFPFQMDSPPFSLSMVSAIVTAAEGLIHSQATGETSNEVEILLPRKEVPAGWERPLAPSTQQTVLTVGLEPSLSGMMRTELEGRGFVVLSAPSTREALLVMDLYGNKFAAVVADGTASSARARRALRGRLLVSQERATLLRLAFAAEAPSEGWNTLVKPFEMRELAAAIEIGAIDDELKSEAAGT